MAPAAKGRVYLDLNPPVPQLRIEEPDMPRIRYLLAPGAQDPGDIPFPLSGEGRVLVGSILHDWGLRIMETLFEVE